MKRLNPKTGLEFKYGDTRSDGKVFRTYTSKVKRDGYLKEVWHSKQTFLKQHEAQKNISREWRAKRLIERRDMINNIKLESGCAICGYDQHPSALDFDHIDRTKKMFDISSRAHIANIDKLLDEISKCRVICANCHRIHSYDSEHHLPNSRPAIKNRIEDIVNSWRSDRKGKAAEDKRKAVWYLERAAKELEE